MALLVCARKAGLRAAGVNVDEQQSLTKWSEYRETQRSRPEGAELVDVPILTRRVDDYRQIALELAGSYDIAFIDTPPGHMHYRNSVHRLCEAADLILIPTGTSELDLGEVIPFRRSTAGDRGVFLLNAVNRRTSALQRAQQRLIKQGKLCPVNIPRLESIAHQFMLGLAAPDTGERGAEDFTAVWDFVRHEVDV
jgi:chromosome partitioning protein